jgi:diadenosine tetraphosphate (Ap4A) HIT family hydrolase
MSDWMEDRIGSAPRGENPLVMVRMRSGFAVIGDTQFMPGYSVLLTDNPAVNHLTDLDLRRRGEFLMDMSLLGEAIETACSAEGLRRMNYSIYGNALAVLHAHVVPRYEWEPAEFKEGPVWAYPHEQLHDAEMVYSDARHGGLRVAITAELERLTAAAYCRD